MTVGCPNHPEYQTDAPCVMCGKEFCVECLAEKGGETYCPDCIESGPPPKPLIGIEWILGILALVGILVLFLFVWLTTIRVDRAFNRGPGGGGPIVTTPGVAGAWTQRRLKQLGAAIETMAKERGNPPKGELPELVAAANEGPPEKTPHLPIDLQNSVPRGSGIPLQKTDLYDEWGETLIYKCPGELHPDGFDLYSTGPNGLDDGGEGDDIVYEPTD